MTVQLRQTGALPVGQLDTLEPLQSASVIYLRLWCDGAKAREALNRHPAGGCSEEQAATAAQSFDALYQLCMAHGRRPLMRHSIHCDCLGADEAVFAHLIGAATYGEREDALMLAMVMVRPDMAPALVQLAQQFGLALKRISLARSAPGAMPSGTTYH